MDHEGHVSRLSTNVADLNLPEFVGAMEETSIQEKKIRPFWRKLYQRIMASMQVPPLALLIGQISNGRPNPIKAMVTKNILRKLQFIGLS